MGPTELLYPALKKGEIDLYADYTGTLWTVVYKQDVINDRQQLISKTHDKAQQQDNIVTLDPIGFNDTFAISMTPDRAKKLGLTKISALAKTKGLTIIGDSTTFTRPDVWLGLLKTYGIPRSNFKEVIVDHNFFYEALKQGKGDITTCATTDGNLKKYGFTVLQDDKGYYPWYDAIFCVNGATLKKYPEIQEALKPLLGKIDEQTMIDLNYKVDVGKQDPGKVAQDWLKSQGLI